jgi:hypothetical protein
MAYLLLSSAQVQEKMYQYLHSRLHKFRSLGRHDIYNFLPLTHYSAYPIKVKKENRYFFLFFNPFLPLLPSLLSPSVLSHSVCLFVLSLFF